MIIRQREGHDFSFGTLESPIHFECLSYYIPCVLVCLWTHAFLLTRKKREGRRKRGRKKWKSRKSSSVALIEDKSMAQSVTVKLLFNAVDQLMLSFLNLMSIVTNLSL